MNNIVQTDDVLKTIMYVCNVCIEMFMYVLVVYLHKMHSMYIYIYIYKYIDILIKTYI